MKIKLTSKVRGGYTKVFEAFDKNLFLYLLPAGAKLIQFGGSKKGDRVEILFVFPLKSTWLSEIVEDGKGQDYFYFIDIGKKLPFGLKSWHHRHVVRKEDEDHSIIEDHMEFSTGNALIDIVFYPGLYLAFLPRVWQYKRYFNKIKSK